MMCSTQTPMLIRLVSLHTTGLKSHCPAVEMLKQIISYLQNCSTLRSTPNSNSGNESIEMLKNREKYGGLPYTYINTLDNGQPLLIKTKNQYH